MNPNQKRMQFEVDKEIFISVRKKMKSQKLTWGAWGNKVSRAYLEQPSLESDADYMVGAIAAQDEAATNPPLGGNGRAEVLDPRGTEDGYILRESVELRLVSIYRQIDDYRRQGPDYIARVVSEELDKMSQGITPEASVPEERGRARGILVPVGKTA